MSGQVLHLCALHNRGCQEALYSQTGRRCSTKCLDLTICTMQVVSKLGEEMRSLIQRLQALDAAIAQVREEMCAQIKQQHRYGMQTVCAQSGPETF